MTYLQIVRLLVLVAQLIAVLAGIYKYQSIGYIWRVFCICLAFTLLLDATSVYLLFQNNTKLKAIFDDYLLIHFTYISYFWFFTQLINLKRKSILFGLLSIIYLGVWLLEKEIIYGQNHYWNSFSDAVGNLIIIALLITYFVQLVQSDALLNFYKLRSFWVSLGVILFYLIIFPFFGMFNYLNKFHNSFFNAYFFVVLYLSIFMNLLFAGSFLWGKES